MKLLGFIYFMLTSTAFTNAQQWKLVAPDVQRFYFDADTSSFLRIAVYRKNDKFVVVETSLEKHFTNLFVDDSSAFDLIYERMTKNPIYYFVDSLTYSIMEAKDRDLLLDLHHRTVKRKKNVIRWFIQATNIGTHGCYYTISLEKPKRNKRQFLKVHDVTGYCLIP